MASQKCVSKTNQRGQERLEDLSQDNSCELDAHAVAGDLKSGNRVS